MGWIYNATNKINGKGYIGQTIHPINVRLSQHQQKSSNCRAFSGAIKKYGWENFVIDCYECPDDELNKHEKWMVNLMGTLSPGGYNLRAGGGSRGKMSEESKQKIRESNSGNNSHCFGKKQNEEHRQKRREAQLGEKNHRYGRPMSEEAKQKNRESNSGEKNPRSKRIYQYELNGTFIDSFGSTEEAGRYLKKDCSSIAKCARGRRKTAYKFKWSYTMDIFI
jgi:group I intron endonuclease